MHRLGSIAATLLTATAVAMSPGFAQAVDARAADGETSAPVAGEPGIPVPTPSDPGPGFASRPSAPAATTGIATLSEPVPDVTGYRTSAAPLFPLPAGAGPYDHDRVLPRGGSGLVDSQGVRMFRVPGDSRLWDHPVAQAQYALMNLNSYRLTHESVYLQRAAANAGRLIEKQTVSGDATYFPYPFDWHFYGDTVCTAPWYSAMAQGQALSAFVRLYEITHDTTWKNAADRTFESLAQAPATDRPFASWVDAAGHLWLEEYPQTDIVSSEKVLNGHIFAIYGLVDYWAMTDTNKARAKALYDGAVTTVQETILTKFRNPAWASFYSMRHQQVNPTYHQVHVAELLTLFQLTHRAAFAGFASTFRADYPAPTVSGRATLARELHRVFRVKGGSVTRVRKIALVRRVTVSVDRRQRTHGHGIMLRIASGRYAGWYAKERYGNAWMHRPSGDHRYRPRPVSVMFQAGTYVGYRYSSTGRRLATRTVRFTRRSTAPSARSAIVGGQSAFEFTTGTWAGYWVPRQAGMVLG